jgi:hypothetical protein
MKLLLEIEENKAAFVLELLQNFRFVKTKQLNSDHSLLLEELKESVDYVNLIKKNKFTPKPLNILLNELQHHNHPTV